MNIVILGTSNSVMHDNYVDALISSGHNVKNLSVGKVDILYSIATFLRRHDDLEQSDLIILDITVNLCNWVLSEGDILYTHISNFYQMISSVNVPVLSINFPSLGQKNVPKSREMAKFIRDIDQKFGFLELDLMTLDLPGVFWQNKDHLCRHVSYGMGLILGHLLLKEKFNVPKGGKLFSHPYQLMDTEQLAQHKYEIEQIQTSRASEKFIRLNQKTVFHSPDGVKAQFVGLGTVMPKNTSGGMVINESHSTEVQVLLHCGSLLKYNLPPASTIVITPLGGIQNLPFYSSRFKKNVECAGYVGLSYILLYDASCKVAAQPAIRLPNTLFINNLFDLLKLFFSELTVPKAKGRLVQKGAVYSVRSYSDYRSLLVKGKSNFLIVSPSASISKLNIHIQGRNNIIVIDSDCDISGKIIVKDQNNFVHIGRGTVAIDLCLQCVKGCRVTIGKYCQISRQVEVRSSDFHSLIDLDTMKRINHNGDVAIGNHVWLGFGTIVNKNVSIADDVVVECSSFVDKSIDESHVAVAGIPARITMKNISWNRHQKDIFSRDELFFWQ